MLPSKIYLIDRSEELATAWREQFAACPGVEVMAGDYFQKPAAALVSPANSFGIMDGGLDLAIRDRLGFTAQERLQAVIVEKYHGEMPVGCAEVVRTDHEAWQYLVAAPTMRVPEPVPGTLNAYLAFRAILVAVAGFNREAGREEIGSLVCCGLGTGIGRIDPETCARQMRAAYHAVQNPPAIPSFPAIHHFHRVLRQM